MSQNLEHAEYLETAFRELDEQTTNFGDGIRELRSSGINIAKAIVSEVLPERPSTLLTLKFKFVKCGLERHLRNPKAGVNLDKLLEDYIKSMDQHFGSMLEEVNALIQMAEVVKKQAQTINGYLVRDLETVDQKLNFGSLFERYWENTGWKGEKMKRDLELADHGIHAITSLIADLKETRFNLVTYRKHIKQFKVPPTRVHRREKTNYSQTSTNKFRVMRLQRT